MIPNPHSARLRPFRPSAFGRYTLLTPLSVGGMGEIFLARLEGPGGFQKLCVIKKILPALAQDPEFVERFVNEARTLVKLSHGAIAQVLDMGLHEGDPYLALEFVDGKDLRKVAARARERDEALPLGFTLYVMGRLLDALAYAHRKRDEDERELGLVHRDVSPQNVLISYEGEVKIIDFGLAKSSLNSARTNPSMILGKFLYMSPEQARHQKVDRRADLYAAGLCLYELVAGRHPFEDVPSHALISQVANPAVVPLRELAPHCPPAVHELVMRALEVDPAKRFQSAEELRAKVGAALRELDPEAGPEGASRYMRELFAAEFTQERKLLIGLRSAQAPEAPVEEEPAAAPADRAESEGERDTAVVPLEQVARDAEAVHALQSGAPLKLTPKLTPQPAPGPILAAPLSFAPTPRTAAPPMRAPEDDDRETVPGVVLGTPLPEGEAAPLGWEAPVPTSELPVLDPSALQFDPDEELAAARRDGTMPRVVIAELPVGPRVEDTQPQVIVGRLLENDAEQVATELPAELPGMSEPPPEAQRQQGRGPRLLIGIAAALLVAATAGAYWAQQRSAQAERTPPPPQPVTQPTPPPNVRAPFATLPTPPSPPPPEPAPPPVEEEAEVLAELLPSDTAAAVAREGEDVLELLEVKAGPATKRRGQKKLTARDVQREWSQLQAVMGRVEKRYGCDHEKLEALCSKRDWLRADLRKVKRASQEDLASMQEQMRELRMKAARVEKDR